VSGQRRSDGPLLSNESLPGNPREPAFDSVQLPSGGRRG